MPKLNDIYTEESHIMKKFIILLVLSLICVTGVFADGYINDPMSIGVGARPLGMGKAYVGVAEDGDAVFMNPVCLARITNPKLSSMYTSLMGDVSYMVVGGAYPNSDRSAIGAGLVNARMADIPLTDSVGTTKGIGSWGNSVMFLSYGSYLPTQLNNRDVLVGGSVKYYSVGGEGSGVTDGAGSGFDLDLGALYPVNDAMMVGVNAQNILPASLGGKITKASGQVDSLPATIKMGTKLSLIGNEGSAFSVMPNRKL